MKKEVKTSKPGSKRSSQFHLAVRAAKLDATPHFETGLGAIKSGYRRCIQAKVPRRLSGSLDMDGACKAMEPGAPRWDYGVGLQLPGNGPEVAIWVEFHPANTSQVDVVLKKLAWLREKLKEYKPLDKLTEDAARNDIRPFHWLPTETGVHIPPHMPQYKRLAACGLSVGSRVLCLP